jgi:hypothetical protein
MNTSSEEDSRLPVWLEAIAYVPVHTARPPPCCCAVPMAIAAVGSEQGPHGLPPLTHATRTFTQRPCSTASAASSDGCAHGRPSSLPFRRRMTALGSSHQATRWLSPPPYLSRSLWPTSLAHALSHTDYPPARPHTHAHAHTPTTKNMHCHINATACIWVYHWMFNV